MPASVASTHLDAKATPIGLTDRQRPPRQTAAVHAKRPRQVHLPANVAVRIIGLRDDSHDSRQAWLNAWIVTDDIRSFNPSLLQITENHSPFDVIVLHGADTVRMSTVLRQWRDLLSSKIIVAVVPEAQPAIRTELYRAGADAVMDPTADRAVSVAWVTSMVERIRAQQSNACADNHIPPFTV